MNYRHGFHAGNCADVFKHYVLTLALAALHRKDTPFCVIDTHAGAGLYRLKKPGEFEQGIGRLWPERHAWPALADYFNVVASYNDNPAGVLRYYPGSPLIIQKFLRARDRALFFELHPQECARLDSELARAPRVTVEEVNGWNALRGAVPPKENRGLVLLDPPYEQPDDFKSLAAALASAAKHWRNGIYLAWYPIKQRRPIERLHSAVRALKIEAAAVEFLTLPADVEQRLNGSGYVLVNPPWKLLDTLRTTLPPLAAFLAGADGRPEVKVLDLC
jgi:23S rRNA (adenine2030-N6)-methyltransferase